MELHIHGIGTCALGPDGEHQTTTAGLEEVPIKEYAKPALRRRYGRVAKMMYVAASRALEDAGIEDSSSLALVTSTAMGEVEIGLKLLSQIHETKGVRISPALVPNSVHNAPAGHLSIGFKNRTPAVTVSQGWLSAEAGLLAASDLLELNMADKVIVVVGDEADPSWEQRLSDVGSPDLSRELAEQVFQEGAASLIVSREPGSRRLGKILAAVERASDPMSRIKEIMGEFASHDRMRIAARVSAGGEEIAKIHDSVELDGPGLGTSQLGALAQLLERIPNLSFDELLLVAREVDDIGVLHWER